MSTYTIQLGTIVAQPTQDRNDLTFDQKLEVGRKHLFDFDYPFFDDRYKDEFERKFIMNFYDREIGYETEFLFKMRLKNWLMINMPYFNRLFESELIKFDPLINSEVKTKHDKKNDGTYSSDKQHDDEHTKDITDEKDTKETIDKTTDKDVDGEHTKDTDRTLDGTYDSEGNRTLDHDYQSDMNRQMDAEVQSSTDTDTQTSENSNTSETGDRTTEEDKFNRELKTDTPDTRLAITANRGESGVGYASEIAENMGDNITTETTSTDSETNTTGNVDTTESTSGTTSENESLTENRQSNDTENTTENRTTKDIEGTQEQGTHSESTDVTENTERNQHELRTIGETGERDISELINGETSDLELYNQHRVGKIGVQTYSKMLTEFRSTFLRIERDCFREMNQLFMLLY